MNIIILTKAIASRFDEITGINGLAYWSNKNDSLESSYEHLENICGELGLDYEKLKAELSIEYYESLKNGELAQWRTFLIDIMNNEPLFEVLTTRAETHWGTNYYLSFLVNNVMNGLADFSPELIKRAWEKLISYNRRDFGSVLTNENATGWNNRVDLYLVPEWMKLEVPPPIIPEI